MIKVTVVIIFLLFIIYGCTSKSNITINEMTVIELKHAIQNDTTLIILDVRQPNELDGEHGYIEGVINIPVQELEKRVIEVEKYKNYNVAVICRSGNRSKSATAFLIAKGFNAKNVVGGMKAYNKTTDQ